MSGSWAPRTRLNGRDHAASCPLSTSPIAENQGARGTEQPRGKQDSDGTATRKTTRASTKNDEPHSPRPSQGVVHRPRRPFRYPAGCRSSPGALPAQGSREGRTPPTLYSKAHALGDLGADIRPQTTPWRAPSPLSMGICTYQEKWTARCHPLSVLPPGFLRADSIAVVHDQVKGETLRDKVIEAVLMNRSRLQPTCCHAPHTPTPLNLTSGVITRRSGFVLSLCQKSYIHARRPSLSSSVVGKGSIDYVRRAIHLNHGDEHAAVELLFEWCHSRKEVLETFVSDDEIKKRVKRAVRKVRRELAG